MAKATSTHFKTALPGAEEHNERKKELDYVRKDLSHLNKTWKADGFVSVEQARRDVAEKYKAAHGRKLPKNATPIQETVVVINSDTTMEQLQHLASRIEDIWGYRPLAIYAHLDEGHVNYKTWKSNLHAHLIFDTTDSRGETLKPMSEKMRRSEQSKWEKKEAALAEKEGREPRRFFPPDSWKKPAFDYMQDLTAECLGMKRGTSSKKKHLDALQYKTKMEEQRLNDIRNEVDELNVTKARKEAAVSSAKAVGEAIKGLVGQSSKDKKIKALQSDLDRERENHKADLKKARQDAQKSLQDALRRIAGRLTYFPSVLTLDGVLDKINELLKTERMYRELYNDADSQLRAIKREQIREIEEGKEQTRNRGFRR